MSRKSYATDVTYEKMYDAAAVIFQNNVHIYNNFDVVDKDVYDKLAKSWKSGSTVIAISVFQYIKETLRSNLYNSCKQYYEYLADRVPESYKQVESTNSDLGEAQSEMLTSKKDMLWEIEHERSS